MPKKRRKRRLGRPSICLCGGPQIYAKCCRPFHDGEALPQTPAELMKSRYTAYAKGLVDYIIDTTHPDGDAWEADEAAWRESIAAFGERFEFSGVDVLETSVDGDTGTVKFRAGLRAGSTDASFEETSAFVRVNGQWFYSSGIVDEG